MNPRDLRSMLAEHLGARYIVEREIGAGGMATVYLAHDTTHDRDVAIIASLGSRPYAWRP